MKSILQTTQIEGKHVKKEKKPPIDELTLAGWLEQVGPANPEFLVLCSESRARWYEDIGTGLLNRTVRESLLFLPPDHPLYGKGPFYNIRAYHKVIDGTDYFCFQYYEDPPFSIHHTIIQAIISDVSMTFPNPTEAEGAYKATRKRLGVMKEKERYAEVAEMLRPLHVYRRGTAVFIANIQPVERPRSPLTRFEQ